MYLPVSLFLFFDHNNNIFFYVYRLILQGCRRRLPAELHLEQLIFPALQTTRATLGGGSRYFKLCIQKRGTNERKARELVGTGTV